MISKSNVLFSALLSLAAALTGSIAQANVIFNFSGSAGETASLEYSGAALPAAFSTGNIVSFSFSAGNTLGASFPWSPTSASPSTQITHATGDASGPNYADLGFHLTIDTDPGLSVLLGTYYLFGATSDSHSYFLTRADFTRTLVADKRTGELTLTTQTDFTTVSGFGEWSSIAPQPVPEPGSLLLVGAALAALGMIRRRRV